MGPLTPMRFTRQRASRTALGSSWPASLTASASVAMPSWAREPLLLRLLHDERDLLDGGREEQRVAARRLDLGELGVHVRRRLLHEFGGAHRDAPLLQHIAEGADRAPSPVGVHGEEVHALH